jgi:hypothetical protein
MLIVPNSLSTGYLYYDNTYINSSFSRNLNEPDTVATSSYKTFVQINDLKMEFIAWNDQLPNGTSSTTKAHSKTVGAFDTVSDKGFVIVHSMPEYPGFNNNEINITIDSSQNIYGQHLFCMTVDRV